MLSKKIYLFLLVIGLITLSCSFSASSPTATPTTDPGPQKTQTAQAVAQATEIALKTSDAASTASAQLTIEAAQTATVSYQETKHTFDVLATATQVQASSLTRVAEIEGQESATAEVVRQITAQAQSIVDLIQPLVEEGVVSSTQGSYVRLDDFDESWAQINWFQWWYTDYDPENFAIRADLFYSSASDKANWFNSGCGFVFGTVDNKNFHVAQLHLDSYVTLKYWAKGNGNWIAKRPTEKLSLPSGEAEIMMVVFEKRVTFFVNGEKALSEYATFYKPGGLAYTLGSGTNSGYGTRCKMTNVDLWIFE